MDADKKKKVADWYRKFADQMDDLANKELSTKDKKEFLKGIVDEIKIKDIDVITHNLEIIFRLNCVDDKLIWKTKKKKDGYDLVEGSNTKNLTMEYRIQRNRAKSADKKESKG